MAAGLGTRLKPYTNVIAKPLLPLMGVPMAQYAFDALRQAGVKNVVANVHHLAMETAAKLRALEHPEFTLTLSDESELLLGSAGGIKKAEARFGGKPFFLINPDVVSDIDLSLLAARHVRLRRQWGVSMTLAILPAAPPGEKYREIMLDGAGERAVGFSLDLQEGRPFYAGAAILEADALAHVPSQGPAEFLPTILVPAINAGRVGAFVTSARWFDIGSPELWRDAHLSWIHGLETGRIFEPWRKRVEQVNERMGPMLWAAKGAGVSRTVGWVGPSYWNPLGSRLSPPREFGPGAVLYGGGRARYESGIGYLDRWTDMSIN